MRITSAGSVGIGIPAPVGALNVVGNSVVSLTSPGYLVLGSTAGTNLTLDYSVIQARYNGTYSGLYLNAYGGYTVAGNTTSSFYGLIGDGVDYGLYGEAPAGTGVYGSGSLYGMYGYNQSGIGVYGFDAGTGHGVYGYETGGGEGVDGYAYGGGGWGVYGYSAQSIGVEGYTANASAYAGYFSGSVYSTGSYLGSDQKLKQNITDLSSAMSVINQLKPKTYNFRQDGNYKLMNMPTGLHYGLIAQDVEKILPNLVKETSFDVDKIKQQPIKPADPKNPSADVKKTAVVQKDEMIDFKALNYTELIPIMIKGMQEQDATAVKQQAIIDKLQQQVDQLQQLVQTLSGNTGSKTTTSVSLIATVSSAYLQQNVPNPFGSATTISYKLPQTYVSAKLVVTGTTGNAIKEIVLSGSEGSVSIDAATLSSGAYQYALYVDGRLIDSKQMILAK